MLWLIHVIMWMGALSSQQGELMVHMQSLAISDTPADLEESGPRKRAEVGQAQTMDAAIESVGSVLRAASRSRTNRKQNH
jgi:hypothetical protein